MRTIQMPFTTRNEYPLRAKTWRDEKMHSHLKEVYENVKRRDPGQPEFHQAVLEVLESLTPIVDERPEFLEANIYNRVVEPERLIQFRVPWVDD